MVKDAARPVRLACDVTVGTFGLGGTRCTLHDAPFTPDVVANLRCNYHGG